MAKNLTLGRGELHFARFAAGTFNARGERYLGNSPEFSATIDSDNLDHMDSDHGINEKDESITLSTNRTGSFTTDNIDPENVALFFFGEKFVFAVSASTVAAEPLADVELGLTYQLGMSVSNPTGARMVSTVVVKKAATTFVEGTDYKVDLNMGRLTILEGGTIVEGDDLTVGYAIAAHNRTRVVSGTTAVAGALRYIAFNPAGPNQDWYMPYVKLSPNGDYNLKGDDWQVIPFTLEILKKEGYEAIYIDGRPYV
jgi:hypothetical protein